MSCSARALHLNDDSQIIEVLDEQGHPAPPGEVGQVVVTQLLCLTLPLIRYRIGDMTRLREEPCPCGRGLRLMSPVLGRTQHTIRSPDGRMLNTVVVSAIMGAIPEIKRYQVRQTGAARSSHFDYPWQRLVSLQRRRHPPGLSGKAGERLSL